MTPTTKLERLAGETDDRPAMVRRYLAELTAEADAKGGREVVIAALRGQDRGLYRRAVSHAARGVLQYSGRGYPEAGLEPYGELIEVAGVRDDVYAWAREIVDELDLIAAYKGVVEVLEAALAAGVIADRPGLDFEHAADDVAEELLRRRRSARAGA